MIAALNIAKFVTDHPEIPQEEAARMLQQARQQAERGILMAAQAEKILGPYARQFFQQMQTDEESKRLGVGGIIAAFHK
jgi:hypothetical protein